MSEGHGLRIGEHGTSPHECGQYLLACTATNFTHFYVRQIKMVLKNITVYCGASTGRDEHFMAAATELGKLFVKRDICLIYGGGTNGMMGQIANTVAGGGGKVIGIIPEFMHANGISGKGPGECIVIETMHQRKQFMCEKADAFIALPGGFGTMEELVEMITWVQLGLHDKPIGILNTNDYYAGFLDWVAKAKCEGMIHNHDKTMYVVAKTPEELLEKLSKEEQRRLEQLNK